MNEVIDWHNPDLDLDMVIGIEDIDKNFGFTEIGDLDSLCDGNCNNCMETEIDDIKTKLSAILCCKSHPETKEVDEVTGVCPEYNMETGKCRIYNTEEYPLACKTYHCKIYNR